MAIYKLRKYDSTYFIYTTNKIRAINIKLKIEYELHNILHAGPDKAQGNRARPCFAEHCRGLPKSVKVAGRRGVLGGPRGAGQGCHCMHGVPTLLSR